jgi:alpha-D-xyloside xylohydrolase
MISVWPKFYDTVKNYKELDSKGWMYHQAIKDDIHDWLGFRGSTQKPPWSIPQKGRPAIE